MAQTSWRMNVMFQRIEGVLFYVSDLKASLAFYQDKLGFMITEEHAENGFALLRFGESWVGLHSDCNIQPGYLPPKGERGRGVIVYFVCG